MITIAHCYNEIINHYDISTQEKLGGGKLREHKNKTKLENNQGGVVGGGGTKMSCNRLSLSLRCAR